MDRYLHCEVSKKVWILQGVYWRGQSPAAAQLPEENFRVDGVDISFDVIMNLHVGHLAVAMLLCCAPQVL